ncbi:Fic family protein [Candidatus Woesearchaeota archaeon]|nr:Fic family protein [Candidatus Woesearchaeota archaeon]
MHIEKKNIQGKNYYYARVSARVGNKVKKKTVAYLGKDPISKKELNKKIKRISSTKVNFILKNMKEDKEDWNIVFLSSEELKKIEEIKQDFKKKLDIDDEKLKEDMFKDFKTEYIYNTNAIEGNSLTLQETNLLLNENITPKGKDLREIYDHINEKDTFDYIIKEKPTINKEIIIDIHQRLVKNIDQRTGSFRKQNVRVFGAEFTPTEAKYVEIDMNILLKWHEQHKRKLHPLILASIFHEKFEKIHPFYDGNGRTGRMLINLIILQNNLPPLVIKNKTRNEYYTALSEGHKADLTKLEPEKYQKIVTFCYKAFIDTYEKIFSKWG